MSINVTIERGVAWFEDGSEVSDVSVKLIKASPKMLKCLKQIRQLATDNQPANTFIHDEIKRLVNAATEGLE
jgi:hypothetical protein